MGNVAGTEGRSRVPGEISLDVAKCDAASHTLTAYIMNMGRGAFSIDIVYLNGYLVPNGNITQSITPLPEGEVAQLDIVYWDYTVPESYEVRIIGKDNTQLVFIVKSE